MPAKQYPKEINEHKNEWVALSTDDRIVGHGKTPEEAIAAARSAGYSDLMSFALLFVPDKWPGIQIV